MSEAASSEATAAPAVEEQASSVESTPQEESQNFEEQVLEAQGLQESEEEPEEDTDQTPLGETPEDGVKAGDDEGPGDEEEGQGADDKETTPKGFVRHEALHAARGEITYLKTEGKKNAATIAELQEKIVNLQANPQQLVVDKDLEGFEILSDADLEDLSLDDPGAFAVYLRREKRYEAAKEKQARVAEQAGQIEEAYSRDTDLGFAEIAKAFPGIYDEGSQVGGDLEKAAAEAGLEGNDLFLTDPRTKIIFPGTTQPVALGSRAAKVLSLLGNSAKEGEAVDEAALRAKITKEVQTELFKKMQANPENFQTSLADIPSVKGDDLQGALREPTDAEILNMTQVQKKNWHLGMDWRA